MSKQKREKLMSFEQIKEARNRVAAKLKNLENTGVNLITNQSV